MKLSYQHVNPSTGGGSYLLRFRNGGRKRTPCLLVDSGTGVDLDSQLDDDEYLAAVLLTHAHLDHYASLTDSLRDGAPVYAAEPTARVLENVLTEGEKNYEIGTSGSVVDALEPIDGWETVVSGVTVAPVPAGHAPGAAGFVVRFEDGTRTNDVLFTGDFTTHPVAGYVGLQTDLPVAIDALFVNVSTTDDFAETLSESLFTVVERVRAGSTVLATASALTGVHYAYLLGHLGDRLGEAIPVTLAGQAAKLYADFGYDVPNVETVPVFDSPADLLERGGVTLAGPEVPVKGSARRLFEHVEDDSSATLVQLTGGATDPVETAACTVYDYEVVNHPAESVIDDLVAEFDPIHVVAGHGPRRALREFRGRYDERFVWASDDDREQTLYADGRWSPPPWLSETAVQSIRARDWRTNGGRFGDRDDDETLPTLARATDPDLEAEGVDVERFESRFGGSDAASDLRVPEDADDDSTSHDATATTAAESPRQASSPQESASATDESDSRPVDDAEAFRRAVLDRLDALAASTDDRPADPSHLRARVIEDEGVTLLRVLGESDLEHGAEVSLVMTDDSESK